MVTIAHLTLPFGSGELKMAVALHLTINVENKLFILNIVENNYLFR